MPPLQKAKPEHASEAEQVEVSHAMKPKKLSRRRGTPWYRHRDAWAKSYWHDFGSMRLAMLARYWISTMRDCEDIAKKYATTRIAKCAT